MHRFLRAAAAVPLAAALLAAGACGSDSGARSETSGEAASGAGAGSGAWENAQPVVGEWTVLWQNLEPRAPMSRFGLVNESSSAGQSLKSGKATSSEIRVLTDAEMGGLVAQLDQFGFSRLATDGLDIDSAQPAPGRKGIVVVRKDGHARGLMLTTNMGASPIPKAYVDSKNLIYAIHSQLPGFDVKSGVGAADEHIFDAPPIRMKRP